MMNLISYVGEKVNHVCNAKVMLGFSLGRNPPVRVTNGQKLCTKIIYIILLTVLNIFSKKSFQTPTNVENKFWTSYETLESTGEMRKRNEMMKFYLCLYNFSSWTLKYVFSSSHGKLSFQATIHIFSFKKILKGL